MARGARRATVDDVDKQKDATGTDAAPVEQSKLYRDLRARNERRANLARPNLARLLDADRRGRVERVLQVARQRRFRHPG